MTTSLLTLAIAGVRPAWPKSNLAPLLAVQGGITIAQAVAPSPVLLHPGAEGDEVMMLQRQMRLLGLYDGPLDGRYGAATQAAIASFQTSAGLPSTGSLDQITWQRMSTPQLLPEDTPAAEPPPVLLPGEKETAEPAAAPPPEQTAENAAAPTAEPSTPAQTVSVHPDRSLNWLILGSLALAAGLGGWLILGRGNKRPQADALTATFPHPPVPSPADTTSDGATAASSNFQAAAMATADLPLEATTRLSPVDIVGSLAQELASSDSAVRRHAIWELGQRGHSDAIQPLVNGLLEADSQEKSLILAALAEIGSRSLMPMHRALALGLQDPSPEVRKNAIRDLSRVYDAVVQLSPMLVHAAQDTDPGVQETARWALNQLNRIPAVPYAEAPSPESTALEPSYEGQQPTPEGHRLSPPHS
ncbi:HEAT repeat domain-containing protein [Nodosilinea nodulosa]|uniref:HEAT repeat domain-containing protein n=1 Tax=Nodosilinea nodulosa TaxID=416001 RepID=UPI000303BABD|nr:HEAT repeat domain-containing protein [Nodosilinea nodulosa]